MNKKYQRLIRKLNNNPSKISNLTYRDLIELDIVLESQINIITNNVKTIKHKNFDIVSATQALNNRLLLKPLIKNELSRRQVIIKLI